MCSIFSFHVFVVNYALHFLVNIISIIMMRNCAIHVVHNDSSRALRDIRFIIEYCGTGQASLELHFASKQNVFQ